MLIASTDPGRPFAWSPRVFNVPRPMVSMCFRLCLILLCLATISACARTSRQNASSSPGSAHPGEVATKVLPRDPGEPWQWEQADDVTASGWSPAGLEAVLRQARAQSSAALMIMTGGRVILSHGDIEHKYKVHSVRKSFVSALYGIYVEAGRIDLRKTLAQLGIDDEVQLTNREKQATVGDLLRARSGVYVPAAAETEKMAADRPKRGSHAPGTHWYYNNWDFNVLAAIFEQQTGRNVFAAFEADLARPLGLQDFVRDDMRWSKGKVKTRFPAYKFRMSTRDMLRFGQMFLQGGRWEGRQVVPEKWVKNSTRAHSNTGKRGHKAGYGFMWWTMHPKPPAELRPAVGAYSASGSGGHKITVIPRLDTVIVHRMDTDGDGPRIVSSQFDEFLGLILAARLDQRVAQQILRDTELVALGD